MRSSINSGANERDAHVEPDETYVIFASFDRRECLGKSDLYISLKMEDDPWSQPIWTGREMKAEGFDGSPSMTRDGRFLIEFAVYV